MAHRPPKLTDLYAWTIVDADGVEGVLSAGFQPLIVNDAPGAERLAGVARARARALGYDREPTLAHFQRVED